MKAKIRLRLFYCEKIKYCTNFAKKTLAEYIPSATKISFVKKKKKENEKLT